MKEIDICFSDGRGTKELRLLISDVTYLDRDGPKILGPIPLPVEHSPCIINLMSIIVDPADEVSSCLLERSVLGLYEKKKRIINL